MRSIGIRELRQHAGRYVRGAEAGETIEVTNRGRPVARLIPIPPLSPSERLIAEGRMTRGTRDLFELGEPLEPIPGQRLPSEVLADMRDDKH